MQDSILSRALQRVVDQQMATFRTQRALADAIKRAYETLSVSELEKIKEKVFTDIAADEYFFTNFVNSQFATNQNTHQAIRSNKMLIEFEKVKALFTEQGGRILHQLLNGTLPADADELPTKFTHIGVDYFGSGRATILTTALFCLWFSLTGASIANVSSHCGVLQKTNLPNDFIIPSDVQNRWLTRGVADDDDNPDILGIPHNGFAYGGHRPYPYGGQFNLDVLNRFISPFSPHDGSSFVSFVWPERMLKDYPMISPTSTDMQFGYRRHLLNHADFQFMRHHINGGSPSLIDPLVPFFEDCFRYTANPRRGDLVLVNRYKNVTDPEEIVVYRDAPSGGTCGIFFEKEEYVNATREIGLDWEGIGLQSFNREEIDIRKKVSFLQVIDRFNPGFEAAVPAHQECVHFYNQRFSVQPDEDNHFIIATFDADHLQQLNLQTPAALDQPAQATVCQGCQTSSWGSSVTLIQCNNRTTIAYPTNALDPNIKEVISIYSTTPSSSDGSSVRYEVVGSSVGQAHSAGPKSVSSVNVPPSSHDTFGTEQSVTGLAHSVEPKSTFIMKGCVYHVDTKNTIGAGGVALVFKGINDDDEKMVAVKVVHLIDAEERRKIENEMSLLSEMEHPHVVKCYGSIIIDDNAYIVLELLSDSLLTFLHNFGPIKNKRLNRYTRQILEALQYLHGRGLVHRDIKPMNVLVTIGGTLKLIDFNISVQLNRKYQLFDGSPPYMPPELSQRIVIITPKFDIWSLGIMLIELFTGSLPALYNVPVGSSFNPKLIAQADFKTLTDGIDFEGQPDLSDFLRLCLERKVDARADCEMLLRHPFASNGASTAQSSSTFWSSS